ncbi:RHS repeat-associated core domain-containing protein [Nonomuraea helvata]|uniref:RHS repeat-associated core domain-containing protein n=1 Tax=Nonomuraea helvata TaxID=37484 RepID=A0ABV5RSG5_9ACTN
MIWSAQTPVTTSQVNSVITSPAVPSGKLQDGWLIRWRVRGLAGENGTTSPITGPWSEWQTSKIEISKPAGSGLGAIPATQSSDAWTFSSLTPQFYMKVVSANGAASYLAAEVEYDPLSGQGSGLIWSGKGTTAYASGSNAWVQVPTGKLVDGMLIRWRVQGVTTNGVAGVWSDWQSSKVDLKKPTVAGLGVTPGTQSAGLWTVSSLTPWAYAQVTDPESRSSYLSVQVEHDPSMPTQGTGLIYAGAGTQAADSGSKAWVQIPAGKLQDGWLVRWRVQGKTTSGVTGPWSDWQTTKIDLKKPTVEGLGMDPAVRGTASWTAGTLTPWLYAKFTDPENRQMKLDVEVEHDPAVASQGTGQIWAGSSDKEYATGTNAWAVVPTNKLKDGWLIRWRARATTASGVSGVWSDWVYARISALPFETFAPENNSQVGSLTPTLSAHARPINEAPVQYWFQVCEGTQPNWTWCESSPNWTTTGAWQVPDGKLTWGKTYWWMAKAATSTTEVTSAWRTFTPAPEQGTINSMLAGGTQNRDFNYSSGNYATTATDVSMPVVGPPLSVTRTYNSLDPRSTGVFGAGWSTRWDMRLEPEPQTSSLLITYPSGEQMRFAAKSDGSYASPAGTFATLAAQTGGGWRLMDKSATSYWFNSAGRLTKITDNRGRSQDLSYGADGKLAKATATGGRSLTFTWTGAHVTSVSTDPVNGTPITWSYSYDGDKLVKVCPPTSSTACTVYAYTDASRYRSAVIDTAPEGYWRLGETATATGTKIANSAGWNITSEEAKLTGATADLVAQVPGALSSSPDTAMRFKGTTSSTYVALPQATLSGKGGYLSVEAWFKTTTSGTVIGEQNSASNTPSAFTPVVYVGTDGKLRGQFYTGAHTPITSAATVNDGQWHHVVLSGAFNTQTLFLDGQIAGTLAGEIKQGDQWETRIGSGYGSSSWPYTTSSTAIFPFNGDIDEVAVYGKPLGAAVVATHYAARLPQPQLTQATLPSGRVDAKNTYNADGGRLTAHTDSNDGTWKLSAPVYIKETTVSTFATVTVTDPLNGTITYVADADRGNRQVSTTDQLGMKTSYGYDTGGYLAKVYDPNDNVVEMASDARGNLLSKKTCRTAGVCASEYFSYYVNAEDPFDPRNDLKIRHRDGRSASASDETYMTSWSYNSFGEQTKETTPATADFPNGRSVAVTYTDGTEPAVGGGTTPAGLIASQTDPRDNTWTYRYTAAGDLAEQRDPEGLLVKLSYDALGRLREKSEVSQAHPDGVKTAITYDEVGRVVTQTEPGVKNEVSGVTHTKRTTYGYDPDNNRLSETISDLTGGDVERATAYTYDTHGRVETATDPEGGVVRQSWNAIGGLATVTDAKGAVVEYGYSKRGELASKTLKEWTGSPVNPEPAKDVVLESFSYDPGGRLAAHSDAMGRKTTFTYFDNNLLAQKTATAVKLNGSTTAARDVVLEDHTYDDAGNQTKLVTGGGKVTTGSVYDAAGRLTSQTLDPSDLNRKTVFTYDANDNTIKTTRTGTGSTRTEITEYAYNKTNLLTRTTVENGDVDLVSTVTYDDRGLATASTDPRGNADGANKADFTTEMRYDALGRLVEATGPQVKVEKAGKATDARPTVHFGYDTLGAKTNETDAEGRTVTSVFDKAGRLTGRRAPSYTPPGGTAVTPTTSYSYDAAGQLISSTDPRGYTTTFDYDKLGRQVRITDPAPEGQTAGTWVSEYDLAGEKLATVDPTGARSEATYDDLGRQITATQIERKPASAAYTTAMEYDDAGRLVKQTAPGSKATSYTVNAAGEVKTVTDPLTNKTSMDYDLAGRLIKTTDPNRNAITAEYDLAGRKTAVKDLDSTGAVLRAFGYGYDAAGNQISATSPEGHVTTQTFDALDRTTSLIEPVSASEQITTSFGYDATGARTRLTDGRGNATWTSYNTLGLVETVTEPSTATHPNPADRTWTQIYDKAGNQVATVQPGGVRIDRTFDHLGRLTKETGAGGGATTAERTFGYDLANRPTTAGDLTVDFNDRGLPLKVSRGTTQETAYGYDELGNPNQRIDAAGTSTFTWDKANRLETATDPVTGRTLTYGYDPASRLKTITATSGTASTQTIDYDNMDRVTGQTLKNGSGTQLAQITYGWDKDDNLTTKTTTGLAGAGTNTYGYDHAGRLTSWTAPGGATTAYEWDAAGNRTKAGNATFTYDERNRLTSGDGTDYTYTPRGTLATSTKAGATTNYTFDAFDRLIADGDSLYSYDALNRTTSRIRGTTKQTFAYAGLSNDLAAIIDSSGAVQAKYARDAGGGLLGLKEGTSAAVAALSDLHGDLVATFTTSLQTSTAYDPFGTVTAQTGTKVGLGYQGEYTDPDTGKVNMHARWYQPNTGTFTSRDTAALNPNPSIQANRYTYANASPLTGIDPTGHYTVIDSGSLAGSGYGGSSYSGSNGSYTTIPAGGYSSSGSLGGGQCIGPCGREEIGGGAVACDIWGCAGAVVDPSWSHMIQLENEKKFWLGDDEIARLGMRVMPNGRPVPKRADGLVIDFWDANWAAQLDFMSKYDPSVDDEALGVMWAITAAYHNQFPTHPDGCYITCAEGPPVSTSKSAEHRAADEFARLWAKVEGPEWTSWDAAKYKNWLMIGSKEKARKYVTDFKERWIKAYKNVIAGAAAYWGVPGYVLAGIAYQEVGGAPPLDRQAFNIRTLTGNKEAALNTSFGPLSIQFRLAKSLLGYKSVDATLAEQIMDLLESPAGGLFLAAKNLRNLHDQKGGAWTESELRRVATAYNGSGPDARAYGDRFMKSLPTVKHLIYGATVSI